MTEAMRDAVRAICAPDCRFPECACTTGPPSGPRIAVADSIERILDAAEPHFAAREAAAVASAVLAEREACAVVLDAEIARTKHRRDIFERMDNDESVRGLNGDIGLLSALAAAIRARSTQESGR